MSNGTNRSTFVTALAWIFIVLGGLASLIAILQNVMIFLLFPRADFDEALRTDPHAQQMPAVVQFMFANFELLFLGFLVVALVTFVSAIGLLKRRNWARLVFVSMLLFGILWNVGGFILQQIVICQFMVPMDAPPDFATMAIVMRVFSGIVVLAFTFLFGWLVWRLLSPDVRAEFGDNSFQRNSY